MNENQEEFPKPAWGHKNGIINLSDDQVSSSVEFLVNRVLISERMNRYGWAFDERQEEALKACFAENATWQANIMGSNIIGPFTGREEIVSFMKEFWPVQTDQRRHIITNLLVEDQTDSTASILTYHVLMSASTEKLFPVTSGFYKVEMVKIDNIWRISTLLAGYDIPF
jgi:hypothetical protein